jgi:hypothetical protein
VDGLLRCYDELGDLLSELAMRVKLDRMLPSHLIGAGAPTEEEYEQVIRELLALRKAIYDMARVAVVDHEEAMLTYEVALRVRGPWARCATYSNPAIQLPTAEQHAHDQAIAETLRRFDTLKGILRTVVAHATVLG